MCLFLLMTRLSDQEKYHWRTAYWLWYKTKRWSWEIAANDPLFLLKDGSYRNLWERSCRLSSYPPCSWFVCSTLKYLTIFNVFDKDGVGLIVYLSCNVCYHDAWKEYLILIGLEMLIISLNWCSASLILMCFTYLQDSWVDPTPVCSLTQFKCHKNLLLLIKLTQMSPTAATRLKRKINYWSQVLKELFIFRYFNLDLNITFVFW